MHRRQCYVLHAAFCAHSVLLPLRSHVTETGSVRGGEGEGLRVRLESDEKGDPGGAGRGIPRLQ